MIQLWKAVHALQVVVVVQGCAIIVIGLAVLLK